MRDKVDLMFAQREIMSEFYSVPARRVWLGKKERDKLWNAVKNGSVAESFLNEAKNSCPALYHQIIRREFERQNIQSAVFSECVYAQALADVFKLTQFRCCLDDASFLSSRIVNVLKSFSLVPRFVYMTNDGQRMLIQAGSCAGVDSALITVFDLKTFTIEFKEPAAKTPEPDLPKYEEDGMLKITDGFIAQYPQFSAMMNEQRGLNFFDVIGSNVHNFSYQSINTAIVGSYCANKFAHVVCTEDQKNKLVMIPTNQVSLWAQTEGEIRPAGRNSYSVWTPLALNKFLVEKGAVINGEKVEIPLSQLQTASPRGGRGVSRYKINSLFFVRAENVVVDGQTARFRISDVLQLNPTIAGKMFFKHLSYDEVKTHYFG